MGGGGDEKRELGKKYHLLFRHMKDKNVSSAQKWDGSIDTGCKRSLSIGR